ncbi:hypothetical protein [Actinoplanes solisilvae]|uniref:hypothetical protein n=1 Tax=Actinoplanes solisilvae TaxID=2486853 RepID=UPI000FD6B9F0|nr:hypothetical protein [Actinoplanes solisilvae]
MTFVGVLGADADKFRWPGLAMLSSLCAAILLVGAVQCGFRARQYLYSPADVDEWWTPADLTVAGRAERLRAEQHTAFESWQLWADRSRVCYNLGIVLFAVAAAITIAPPRAAGPSDTWFRWFGAAIAMSAAIAELILGTFLPMIRRRLGRMRQAQSVTADLSPPLAGDSEAVHGDQRRRASPVWMKWPFTRSGGVDNPP